MILNYFFLFLLIVTGCGEGEEYNPQEPMNKVWRSLDITKPDMDFSDFRFDAPVVVEFYDAINQVNCACLATFNGSLTKGIYTMNCQFSCPLGFTELNTEGGSYEIKKDNHLYLCRAEDLICLEYQ